MALAETYARLGNAAAAETERKLVATTPPDLLWPDPILAEVEKGLAASGATTWTWSMCGCTGSGSPALALFDIPGPPPQTQNPTILRRWRP